jgi:hypothetical protein
MIIGNEMAVQLRKRKEEDSIHTKITSFLSQPIFYSYYFFSKKEKKNVVGNLFVFSLSFIWFYGRVVGLLCLYNNDGMK